MAKQNLSPAAASARRRLLKRPTATSERPPAAPLPTVVDQARELQRNIRAQKAVRALTLQLARATAAADRATGNVLVTLADRNGYDLRPRVYVVDAKGRRHAEK